MLLCFSTSYCVLNIENLDVKIRKSWKMCRTAVNASWLARSLHVHVSDEIIDYTMWINISTIKDVFKTLDIFFNLVISACLLDRELKIKV